MQASRGKSAARGVPLHQHLVALGVGEQGDVAQARGGGQGEQGRTPVLEQPLHGRGLEAGRVVDGTQAQGGAREDGEGERVVGALEALDVAHLDGRGQERGIERIVLEDEQGVEERRAAGHLAEGLHLDERRVLVLALLELLGLERLEPGHQRGRARGKADAGGQRVDEDAHHGVGAGQLGRPARDGVAEDDVLLAAVAGEDEAPRGEGQGVQRELVLAGEGLQGGRGLGGEVQLEGGLRGLLALRRRGVRVGGQRRGGGEALQVRAPVRLVGGGVAARQPGDVVAEGRPGRGPWRGARAEGVVEGEDLLHEEAEAPAIHQQVVVAPEEAQGAIRQAHRRQAHEGRVAQVEAALPLLAQELLEAALLLGGGQGRSSRAARRAAPPGSGPPGAGNRAPPNGRRSGGGGGAGGRRSRRAGRPAGRARTSPSRRAARSRWRTRGRAGRGRAFPAGWGRAGRGPRRRARPDAAARRATAGRGRRGGSHPGRSGGRPRRSAGR